MDKEHENFIIELKAKTLKLMDQKEITTANLEEHCAWIEKKFKELYPENVDIEKVKGILAVIGASDLAKTIEDTITRRIILAKGLARMDDTFEEDEEEE